MKYKFNMRQERGYTNLNPSSLREICKESQSLRVEHSGVVKMQNFDDYPDGDLVIGEVDNNIPQSVKRFYYIKRLKNPEAIRGKHAHKNLKQVIFCITGKFTLMLDDGYQRQAVRMDTPNAGVILDGPIWHEMRNFTKNCVILVIANESYDPNDYIRNYGDFLKFV